MSQHLCVCTVTLLLSPHTAHGSNDSIGWAEPDGEADMSLKPAAIAPLVQRDPFETWLKSHLLGGHRLMRMARDLICRYSKSDHPVLITGETGDGKSLAAAAIHRGSSRGGREMLVAILAGLRETAMSELFGHRKGAFTGALEDHDGLLKQADRSTICLEDVPELPPPVQPLLLRAIEEKKFRPLGGVEDASADVRVIATANRPLDSEVAQGRFRRDLYHRLRVLTLFMPPLRSHLEDLRVYVPHFLGKILGPGQTPKVFTDGAMNVLYEHDWLGNVRELENLLQRVCASIESDAVGADEVRDLLTPESELMAHSAGRPSPTPTAEIVRTTLAQVGNNKRETARRLKMSHTRFYRLLSRLGIVPGASETPPRTGG